MSLLEEQQPESQLEEAKGLLLAVGGEEGLLALIDVANKKTVSNRCTLKKQSLQYISLGLPNKAKLSCNGC